MVTNQLGFAEFTFPKSYKGDSEGKLNLELLLSEDYKCNPVVINQTKICTPHIPENLFKERVLWSTNDRIQIWFLLSYIGVVGGVWAAIGYIIYLLVRIKISGKKVE
jgi:hypothetical protein